MFLPLLRLYFPITGVSCSVFTFSRPFFPVTELLCLVSFVFTTLFSSYWTFVSRFSCFRDSVFQLLDFRVSFLRFSRHRFPVTGLLCLISPLFPTPFSSYWTFVSRFSRFHDTVFQLLDFFVSFLRFSRHCFPVTGLLCLISFVFETLFSSYWTFVSHFSPFRDTIFHLMDFYVSFLLFSRHCFPITGLSCLISFVFETPFSSYWTFVSRLSLFHDYIFHLLDYPIFFIPISRHRFPFTGLSCLVYPFFTTVFSIYWITLSSLSLFLDTVVQLLFKRIVR